MNRRGLSAAALAIGLMLIPNCDSAFAADRRVALVIGNSSYQNAPILANPAKDAEAMAESFKVAGFDVVTALYNLGIKEFLAKLRRFEDEAANADIAVIYYAGNNFMLPVDAKLVSDRDARDEAVSLGRLLEAVEGAKRLRLVILDACRDNPLAKTMKRQLTASLRAVTQGLALVEPTTNNSLIAYAAKAGAAAEDGNADHSPYTTALLTHLFVPGLDIRMALRLVRDDVVRATGNRQEPFQAGSLGGANIALVPTLAQPTVSASDVQAEYTLIERFALDPRTAIGPAKRAWEGFVKRHPTGWLADIARQQIARLEGMDLASRDPIVVPAPPAASSEEQKVWNGIKDSSDPAKFRDFIRRFPTSVLAMVAEKHLEALERAQKEREEKANAERDEKARIAREAKAAEEARLKAEREAKAAEEARLKAEREAAARRAEEERLAKLSEAERARAERELELKRLEQERQAKLAEEASLRQEV